MIFMAGLFFFLWPFSLRPDENAEVGLTFPNTQAGIKAHGVKDSCEVITGTHRNTMFILLPRLGLLILPLAFLERSPVTRIDGPFV